MAPELARGGATSDPRADVWAVGVMLYEMLLGHRPYEADGHRALLAALAHAEPIRFLRSAPDASPTLCAVVERALAPAPEDRFDDLLAFRDALAACPESQDPDAPWAPSPTMRSTQRTADPPTLTPTPAPLRAQRPAGRHAFAVVAACLLLGTAALGLSAARRSPPRPVAAARASVAVISPSAVLAPAIPAPAVVAPAPVPRRAPRRPRAPSRALPSAARGVNGAPILEPPG